MTKYEFSFSGYDYKMEYDEKKSSNEWSIDEETSYLFYNMIQMKRQDYKIKRILSFLGMLMCIACAIMFGLLIPEVGTIWFEICSSVVITVLTFVSLGLLLYSVSSDPFDDELYEIKELFTYTQTGLKQRNEQIRAENQKKKNIKRDKAIKLNKLYKTLNDTKMSEIQKISEITKYID